MSDPTPETNAEAQDAPPSPQSGTAPQAEAKSFDAAYVEKLREEAAKWRVKAREYEAAHEQAETAKLGEVEKAQKRLRELEERATATERALRAERARTAVLAEAERYNLPGKAAARLITPDSLEYDDDGLPKPSSVRAALKALAEELPELTVQARSANPARGAQPAETDEQRRRRLQGGGVNPFDPATARTLGGGVFFPTEGTETR